MVQVCVEQVNPAAMERHHRCVRQVEASIGEDFQARVLTGGRESRQFRTANQNYSRPFSSR